MIVAELITRVRQLLQDSDAYRWTDAALLDCYNESLMWVVQQRPDANSAVVTFNCELKSQQAKPVDAYRVMGVLENSDSGRAIEPINREDLNALDPNWSQASWNGYVEFYLSDERTPDVFWLYPHPTTAHDVSLQISKEPVRVTDASTAEIEIPLIHLNALKHSMMAYAYLTDGETEGNLMQANNYLKLAANDLNLKWSIDLMFSKPVPGGTDG